MTTSGAARHRRRPEAYGKRAGNLHAGSRGVPVRALLAVLATLVLVVSSASAVPTSRTFRDTDGHPLPFTTDVEVLDFLRTADVVSTSAISAGSTKPLKVVLEKDGVRMHAIFRSFERVQRRTEDPDTGQTRYDAFKDSATFEAAAYELATLLNLSFVPPVVRRVVNNRDGTLQVWIEATMSETERQERGIEPPHPAWWRGVLQTLVVFDNLISNADRNTGNLIIDADWGVWFIDHTRAFQTRRNLRNPEHIEFCERRLYEQLRDLSDEDIRARMEPYLDGLEIGALLRRRARIVKHIDELIEENGADAVLFTYSHDLSDWGGAR